MARYGGLRCVVRGVRDVVGRFFLPSSFVIGQSIEQWSSVHVQRHCGVLRGSVRVVGVEVVVLVFTLQYLRSGFVVLSCLLR